MPTERNISDHVNLYNHCTCQVKIQLLLNFAVTLYSAMVNGNTDRVYKQQVFSFSPKINSAFRPVFTKKKRGGGLYPTLPSAIGLSNRIQPYTLLVVSLYRMYLRCLNKRKGWILPTKTKKNHIYIVRKWVVFRFNWKITFHNKCLNCLIFYSQLTQYIYNTPSQFNNCWVLIVYQVTIYNRYSKFPPPPRLIKRRMDRSDHGPTFCLWLEYFLRTHW
jgi:hypothetical protein